MRFFLNSFADTDECLTDKGGCDHVCDNTDGSYSCSCYSGYTLNNDQHTCRGQCEKQYSMQGEFRKLLKSHPFDLAFPP